MGYPNSSPRSELYVIDRKFTGEDRSLYQAFQKEIKIALKRNADRYYATVPNRTNLPESWPRA